MNPLTLEWAEKAENDLLTARREFRVREKPNYDAVCFQPQQSTEKYSKAMIQERNNPVPRLHSLAELLAIISQYDPEILLLQSDANIMEGYAVQFRYPGLSANKDEAKAALSAADRVVSFVKMKLGL